MAAGCITVRAERTSDLEWLDPIRPVPNPLSPSVSDVLGKVKESIEVLMKSVNLIPGV
jgi:hypothetical protein